MSWLRPIAKMWRLLERGEAAAAARRRRVRRRVRLRALLEQLETRLAPAATFDPATGLLTVSGDEAGPRDDVIHISIVDSGFLSVSINGRPQFGDDNFEGTDPLQPPVQASAVLAIAVHGLEGNDRLTVRGRFRQAEGHITIDGGAGNDRLVGSSVAELILGGAGDDWIVASRGDDTVDGGGGNDQIQGSAGHDSLVGGAADDTLNGSSGDDTLVGGTGDDRLVGGRGDNTLIDDGGATFGFDADTGLLTVNGDEDGPTNDVIGVSVTPGGFVEVVINGVVHFSDPSAVTFDPALTGATATSVTSILLHGLEGDDSLTVNNGFAAAGDRITLDGAGGDDTIVGTSGADTIRGGPGSDSLTGGPGDDLVVGDDGTDFVNGQEGVDSVSGGGDAGETVFGGPGADLFLTLGDLVIGISGVPVTVNDFDRAEGDHIELNTPFSLVAGDTTNTDNV